MTQRCREKQMFPAYQAEQDDSYDTVGAGLARRPQSPESRRAVAPARFIGKPAKIFRKKISQVVDVKVVIYIYTIWKNITNNTAKSAKREEQSG